jgi:cyanophycinase
MAPSPALPSPFAPRLPLYCFADSQLLFWHTQGQRFLPSLSAWLPAAPRAVYIGAANGDHPAFFALFAAAMAGIGIAECSMIRASFPAEDRALLQHADLILLAGGDVERGWQRLQAVGFPACLRQWYAQGALLIGVSAGAVHVGRGTLSAEARAPYFIEMLQLVPFVIGVHEESENWAPLRRAMCWLGDGARGVGIPAGGGAIYYPEGTCTALRHPLQEISGAGVPRARAKEGRA